MTGRQNEPIFVRSRWGYRHWVLNWENPVGLTLIVIIIVAVLGFSWYMFDDSRWSESEFRDAVRASARNLEARPQDVSVFEGYEPLISDAIERTGKGPPHGAVQVTAADTSSDSSDNFDITVRDVDSAYCMSINPPAPDFTVSVSPSPVPDTLTERAPVRLSVQVRDGSC